MGGEGEIDVRCRCGEVRGVVKKASAGTVNRLVCYCDDCQAFAHHLGRADMLNEKGGSDIVQVAPATFFFTSGEKRIAGLRLSPKGLYRWHTTCCNTPIGNTMGPGLPFVGLLAPTFVIPRDLLNADDIIGPPTGALLGKFAIGEPPAGSTSTNLPVLLRAVARIFGWKFSGKTWPHPFFSREMRAPTYPVTVLSKEQRDALRPFCGPHPTAQATA